MPANIPAAIPTDPQGAGAQPGGGEAQEIQSVQTLETTLATMLETTPELTVEIQPFWRTTALEDMDDQQWESLCDGCGRCCLIKLEDEDTGRIHYTDVGCRLLDGDSCHCRDYPNRQVHVPDCVRLTPETVRTLTWLPPTCGYRLVREGIDLPWWHPLVSGDPDTVIAAGVSVSGKLSGSEQDVDPEDLVDRIVQWPDRVPRRAKGPPQQVSSQLPGGRARRR